jgi:signal transduction histidine kinase
VAGAVPDASLAVPRLAAALRELVEAAVGKSSCFEIAQLTTYWIAELLPDSCSFGLQVDARRRTAVISAGANMPFSWFGTRLQLPESAAFAAALREPGVVQCVSGIELSHSLSLFSPLDAGRGRLFCVAIPGAGEPTGILCALVDPARIGDALGIHILGAVGSLLAAVCPDAHGEAQIGDGPAAIERAKREWECTADALSELVCLVNRAGQVIRANRALERWALGGVREVRGRGVHQVLHPHCRAAHCDLESRLAGAWERLGESESATFEHEDAGLGKRLEITLRLMVRSLDQAPAPSESHAVMVVSDITELHRAQEALRSTNESLETRVLARTRELKDVISELRAEMDRRQSAEAALVTSRNELALLSGQLMTAQEDERRRISQELHDAVGQSLSAIKYSVERAVEMIGQPLLGDPRLLLQTTVDRVKQTIDDMRSIAMNLRPSMLDDLGAVSAVRWLCREYADVYPDIDVEASLDLADGDVPAKLGTPVFRIVQEALNNVARHAKARRVVVSLRRVAEALVLRVVDDGVGFTEGGDGRLPLHGHGLRGMRERAEMSGGEFRLTSAAARGATVHVEWLLLPEVHGEPTSCTA